MPMVVGTRASGTCGSTRRSPTSTRTATRMAPAGSDTLPSSVGRRRTRRWVRCMPACPNRTLRRGSDQVAGTSKNACTRPPGASQGSTSARARAGSRWKSPTRTAKITSNVRVPRSRFSRLATRNSALPAATCAELRRFAASIILADLSMPVRRPVSSCSQIMVAATPWPQPISRTRSPGWRPSWSTTVRRRSLTEGAYGPCAVAVRRTKQLDVHVARGQRLGH